VEEQSGHGMYADAMMELDAAGRSISRSWTISACDTPSWYLTSDNGAEVFSCRMVGNSPFRGEEG